MRPKTDGGNKIEGYTVEARQIGDRDWIKATPQLVTDLHCKGGQLVFTSLQQLTTFIRIKLNPFVMFKVKSLINGFTAGNIIFSCKRF